MKTSTITICFFFLMVIGNAQEPITGIWNTGKDNTKVKIIDDNGIHMGTIVTSENAKTKIGKQLLKDIKAENGIWKGKLYNPKKNKWYDAVLKRDATKLLVTIDAGFVGKTLEWIRD